MSADDIQTLRNRIIRVEMKNRIIQNALVQVDRAIQDLNEALRKVDALS